MLYKKIIATFAVVGIGGLLLSLTATNQATATRSATSINVAPEIPPLTFTSPEGSLPKPKKIKLSAAEEMPPSEETSDSSPLLTKVATSKSKLATADKNSAVFVVPFYSQFNDITSAEWQKVGCGIASLAMLIEFFEPGTVSVDKLLKEGISANAYLSNAGWTHQGLINLSKKYGLTGSSKDMAGSSMADAFAKLEQVLEKGPVMVSVHYTFDPKNPIPHLVVINGVNNGLVYYNDPAESTGGGTLPISKFQSAWKKRYIEIHQTT